MNDNGERERLVAELKEYASFMGSYEDEPERKRLMTEAADLLEADAAEINRLKNQLASLASSGGHTVIITGDLVLADDTIITGDIHTHPPECTIVHSEDPSAPAYLALGAVKVTRERCG